MRRLLTFSVCVLLGLLLTGQAFATKYEQVIFAADCNEWNADITVRLFWYATEVDLAYDVAIEDLEGNVLLSGADVATIVDDDGDHWGSVTLGSLWDDMTDEIIPLYGLFRIHATFTLVATPDAPVSDPVHEEFITSECAVVPNADVAWGAVKSAYR